MLEHRFRSLVQSTSAVAVAAGPMGCSFVPCPAFHAFAADRQAQIAEIYRLAAERTRDQLEAKSRPWLLSFSAN